MKIVSYLNENLYGVLQNIFVVIKKKNFVYKKPKEGTISWI